MTAKARSGKRRTKTYAQRKREFDRCFSEFIRRSYADPSGTVACVTCGLKLDWKRMQCGHYISRVHLATRWDERNAAPQCYACNVWRRGNLPRYTLWITTKYGPNVIQELVDKSLESVKFTRSDLQEKIDQYKERLQRLA